MTPLRQHQVRFLLEQQQFKLAARLAETVSEAYRCAGNERGLSVALSDWGIACWRLDNNQQAAALLAEGLSLAEKLNDQRQIAYILHHLGNLSTTRGEMDKARPFLRQALTQYEASGDQRGLANVLSDFGSMVMWDGDVETAQSYYLRSVAIHKKLDNMPGAAFPAGNLGYLYLTLGEYEKAEKQINEVFRLAQRYGMKAVALWQNTNLGHLALAQGNYAAATHHYRQVLGSDAGEETIKEALLGAATVIAASSSPKKAASLLPAIQYVKNAFPPFEKELHENLVTALPAVLSEEEWRAAQAQGEAMTLDEAASWASVCLPRPENRAQLTRVSPA